MRGFAASRGDDDAIDEAQRDVELMRVQIAALEAKVGALRTALEAVLPLVRRGIQVVDFWNSDPDKSRISAHPFTREADAARKALEATK